VFNLLKSLQTFVFMGCTSCGEVTPLYLTAYNSDQYPGMASLLLEPSVNPCFSVARKFTAFVREVGDI